MIYNRGDKVLIATTSHGRDYFGGIGTIVGAWKNLDGKIITYEVKCEHPTFGSIRNLRLGKDEIRPLGYKGSSDYVLLVDRLTEEGLRADLTSKIVDGIEDKLPFIDPDLSRDIADSLVDQMIKDEI